MAVKDQVQDEQLKQLAMDIPTFLSQSRSKNTQDRYKSGFNKWLTWSEKFSEISSLPAKPIHVALFLTKLLQSNESLSVIESSFYAIKHFHKIACLDDPTSSDLCKNMLEAAKRTAKNVIKKKEPISSLHLHLIYDHIGGTSANLLQLRNFVIVLLSFAGFFRFSEVANLRRSDVTFNLTHMTIFIERSKTDIYRDGNYSFIAKTHSALCPVETLQRYFVMAGICDESEVYLFRSVSFLKSQNRYVLRINNIPISYTTAREAVMKLLGEIGLNPKQFGLHSLRSGGASAAANNEIKDRLFKRHGRWKSERAKDGYVKDSLDDLLSVSLGLGL